MITLTFYGGAQDVTGSKHLITTDSGTKILLDCGMFQGRGATTAKKNQEFGFEASSIHYLILSHAHIDHCGLIPKLVKEGFAGQIFCTPPTIPFAKLILEDSAGIQHTESENIDGASKALYNLEDVSRSLELFVPVPYNLEYEIEEGVNLTFTDAGHILGSAVVNLNLKIKHRRKQVCFTGDLGRFSNRILNSPQPCPPADYIICESTYGDRLHDPIENTEEKLRKIVFETCVEKKGKLLIPAFSIGRTQELIYSLNVLAEDGRLPKIPVFVDSPLSVYATNILRDNMEYFNEQMQEYIKIDPDPFGFKGLTFISDKEDSKLLNTLEEPCVIISSSGMMEGGRIRHHLRQYISDPNTTILITGYCEPSTLGGQIAAGARTVNIMGDEFEVNAKIEYLKEYSAHGDYGDILKFLLNHDKEKLKALFLVHGEKSTMLNLKHTLKKEGYGNIEMPEYMISYSL